ncbi:MAG: hypothetical protein V4717_22210 [Bacteroidota bacterium]
MDDYYKSLKDFPQRIINRQWPNLNSSNHELTSPPTSTYNCVAWANGMDHIVVDLSLDEDGEPLIYPDLSCWLYIEYYQKAGFELCDSHIYEQGYEKIALYENSQQTFEHVALQRNEGVWLSKVGELEDIQHTTLEALQCVSYYGLPKWFMKRKITNT